MTEQEWLGSTDWIALWHAMSWEEEFDRKRRLIATAICRQFSPLLSDARLIQIMDMSEAIADGQELEGGWRTWERVYRAAEDAADDIGQAAQHAAAWVAVGLGNDDHKIGRALEGAPDVFGYLAVIKAGILPAEATSEVGRSIETHPLFIAGRDEEGGRVMANVIREVSGNPFRPVAFDPTWRSDTVVLLARQMYEARDFSAMPILADALQDAGCENEDILRHCRDAAQVHVRGCWVCDAVLGKS